MLFLYSSLAVISGDNHDISASYNNKSRTLPGLAAEQF
jgi:hypothetical protein